MRNLENRLVVPASRPVGVPRADHFTIASAPVAEFAPGQILVARGFEAAPDAMAMLHRGENTGKLPIEVN